jgi:hypothetical protein
MKDYIAYNPKTDQIAHITTDTWLGDVMFLGEITNDSFFFYRIDREWNGGFIIVGEL